MTSILKRMKLWVRRWRKEPADTDITRVYFVCTDKDKYVYRLLKGRETPSSGDAFLYNVQSPFACLTEFEMDHNLLYCDSPPTALIDKLI